VRIVLAGAARRRQRRLFAGHRAGPRWWARFGQRRPRGTAALVGLCVGTGLAILGGPVAGLAGVAYAALGVSAALRRRRATAAAGASSRALDAIAGLAADLRAGLAPEAALAIALPALAAAESDLPARLTERVSAAWQVAELAGAPLADLLDRLEIEVRSRDRLRRSVAAAAAGTVATAGLLAVLPGAGIAVGYAMGTDPLHILLRTPLGAAAALLALSLQLAGLFWAGRLARSVSEAAG
jgi:tight adherence protein B